MWSKRSTEAQWNIVRKTKPTKSNEDFVFSAIDDLVISILKPVKLSTEALPAAHRHKQTTGQNYSDNPSKMKRLSSRVCGTEMLKRTANTKQYEYFKLEKLAGMDIFILCVKPLNDYQVLAWHGCFPVH